MRTKTRTNKRTKERTKKMRAFDFIEKFADQNADQNTPLVRCLVRLVHFGPLWSGVSQVSEKKRKTPDQNWTKSGPNTYLDRSPRPFRAGGGSVIGLNKEAVS